MLGLTSDNYKEHLKEWFGRIWVFNLGSVIASIKLPEFFGEEESRTSLRSVWIVAVNERERRDKVAVNGQLPHVNIESFPAKPSWGSWIERTVKEDA